MTTFVITDYFSDVGDPNQINFVNGAGDGDLLVVSMCDRSGTTEADHVVTDDNGGTWVKRLGFDNLIGDANARQATSVWTRRASDGLGDDTAFFINGDDGSANDKLMQAFSITPSAAYDFTYEVGAIAGSGTADWDALASGNTSNPGGSDLFELAVATARNSADEPLATNFTAQTDSHNQILGEDNGLSSATAIEAAGQTSGAKTATINSDGSGNEGVCAVLIFSDGGVAGTIPHNPLGYPILGPVGGPTA